MTNPLQAAMLGGCGIYPQTALGTAATGAEYFWFRHNLNNVGPQQILRDLGQLVGGTLLPGGQIKTGAMSGGRLVMPPPLDDYIWWLFYAFAGAQEATPDNNGDGTYIHYAPDKTAADASMPEKYLTIHRIIPTAHATNNKGEQLIDQTVVRSQINIVGGQIVTSMFDFLGLAPSMEDVSKTAPSQGWVPAPKGKASVPIAAEGLIQLPVATSLSEAQALSIDLVNVTPGYDEVAIIASYYPHSFPIVGRTPVLTLRQLYATSDLYRSIFYDGAGTWTPIVYNTDFKVEAESAELIRASNDTEQETLSYTLSGGNAGIKDNDGATTGQDFSAYEVAAPGTATYWIEVTNSDGSKVWGYCGDATDEDGVVDSGIEVYQDNSLTSRGWNGPSVSGKTPTSYNVYPNRRYKLGFQAESIDWTATPVPLEGGRLIRLDVRGQMADAESGLDWHIYVQNKTASYTWPS